MTEFTVRQAASACHAKEYDLNTGSFRPAQGSGILLTTLCTDSREAEPGCLFAAIPGERVDGHQFIPMALDKGAAAVLCQRPELAEDPRYQDPRVLYVDDTLEALLRIAAAYREKFSVKLAAVTGSVGKTTTKEMIWTALCARYNTMKSLGNQNNEIGLPRTLMRLEKEHQAAVVEMGMCGFNEIRPLTLAAKPDAVVLTNIGVSHLERLGSRENILKAKLEILEGLQPDGALIVNADNDLLGEWYRQSGKQLPFRLLPFGINSADAVLRAKNVVQSHQDCRFTLCYADEEYPVRLPCVGIHNVYNALAAVAAALAFDIPLEESTSALAYYEPSGMRQRLRSVNQMMFVEDCYNASPDSMTAAISSLKEMNCPGQNGRKILVLSDMLELGKIEHEAHRAIGHSAADAADALYVYGTLAKEYEIGAKESGMKEAFWFADKVSLTAALRENLCPGDLVWFKASRGMALEEVIDALSRGEGGAEA